MNFSIVIPTYNREEDLKKCLDSILLQSLLPQELLIIDDGELSDDFIEHCRNKFERVGVSFVYYKKNHEFERRGLSESKNKALDLVSNQIFFIFDDDVVLEKDFCELIISVWHKKEDKNLIGVGGVIKNRRRTLKIEKFYNRIFGLSSKFKWDVNKACFQVWDEEIDSIEKGYYTHGGACSYSLDKVRELKFSTFSGGRTALEDVDFCLRAKNAGYYFLIEPMAQLFHYPSEVSREGKYMMGYKEGYNRKIIFKSYYKKPSFYLKTWFCWANLGWILRQFLSCNFRKGWGMIRGLCKDLFKISKV